MTRPIKTESPRHTEAFERYYAMGRDRSYARLSAEIGVDENTIKLWGRSFNWQERLDARDREIASKVREQSTKSSMIDRGKRRKAAEYAFIQWFNDLKAGKHKTKFDDFKELFQFMEAEDRERDGTYLTLTSTPEQIVAFFDMLTNTEWDEINRILRARTAVGGDDVPPSKD